jgi:hypothetical protein
MSRQEALRSGGGCCGQGPTVEHRFDAGRLDQVELRLPLARREGGIGGGDYDYEWDK